MLSDEHHEPTWPPSEFAAPVLNEAIRHRLGQAMQAMYEPVIDEPLDPRLAELMQQLASDRER